MYVRPYYAPWMPATRSPANAAVSPSPKVTFTNLFSALHLIQLTHLVDRLLYSGEALGLSLNSSTLAPPPSWSRKACASPSLPTRLMCLAVSRAEAASTSALAERSPW